MLGCGRKLPMLVPEGGCSNFGQDTTTDLECPSSNAHPFQFHFSDEEKEYP
jgi:hypothetical protein